MRHALAMEDPRTTAILDRLDQSDEGAGVGVNRRRCPRFRYRVEAVVEFFENEESTVETAPCRNLSRVGVSFLLNRFVEVGTAVRVQLVGAFDQGIAVDGRVARVRYLAGTPGVHECGVVFPRPIEIERFCPEAAEAR